MTDQKKNESALQQRIVALTQPLDDSIPLRFEDLFNIDEIQEIQDAFARATGVGSLIIDPQGRAITRPSNFCRLCQDIIRKTELGQKNCKYSDIVIGQDHPGGPILQPCLSGGLWDGGATISVGNHRIASWLIGQVIESDFDEENMLAYANVIGADLDEYRSALKEVTRMPRAPVSKHLRCIIFNCQPVIQFGFTKRPAGSFYQRAQNCRRRVGQRTHVVTNSCLRFARWCLRQR